VQELVCKGITYEVEASALKPLQTITHACQSGRRLALASV
jgi:hypothetical protein